MTAQQMTINDRSKQLGMGLLLLALSLLLLAGILALSLTIVNGRSHAVVKHGSSLASFARRCEAKGNIFQKWQSFQRGTKAQICEFNIDELWDDTKEWSIRIIDSKTNEEITVFRHVGNYESLEEYLFRQTYFFMG